MKNLEILIFKILFWYFILAEEIEFYPSKVLLDSYYAKEKPFNKITKRETDNNEKLPKIFNSNGKGNRNQEIYWRRFENDRKVYKKVKNQDKEVVKHSNETLKSKRAADPVFHGHPKTREEMWNENFLNKSTNFDQTSSLIKLIHNITLTHLYDCTPVILYDYQIKSKESYLFQNLLKDFPVTYIHGFIDDKYEVAEPKLLKAVRECLHYIVFITEVQMSGLVLGKQSDSNVVIVARSSQWAVQEFLATSQSRMFINLLIIGQSFKEDDENTLETPYILYTHKLYTDGLGSSMSVVLTSWSHGKYSRNVNLFPKKMTAGYAGHRFLIAAANQPPFVVKRIKTDADGGNPRITWDGIEVRLLHSLAERNNFSIEFIEPQDSSLGSGDAVAKEIAAGRADIGIAGMYMTSERSSDMDLTFGHSQDCAVFITLMSTALPRYRAILGPFHWHVWVALTFTYLFGIFPLAFSDKHTLRHLLHDSGEVENMFWYVFGTFTNCFTFTGKNSWSKTDKITTRLLIGWYWLFTIIITSCYTGSIIAFVTLPMFPETVDTIEQLLKGFYRVGTLDRGGWERWFFNSSDAKTNKLMKKLELVPNLESGIRNTTKAFFWPYAFLGSQAELEYVVQTNYTAKSKRAQLHISNECFVPFSVTMGFPINSLYTAKLSGDVMRMLQSGLIDKIVDEVHWELQRSGTGKFLAAGSGSLKITTVEEKGLTLEDTQGMFLLLAAGFLMAATALLSEWMGGFGKRCHQWRKGRKAAKHAQEHPSSHNSRENLITTPKSEQDEEINMAENIINNKLSLHARSSSAESKDTLEGQIINVTEENIQVHNNLDLNGWDSRRSSTIDLDKEVREIFERDHNRRRIVSEEVIDLSDEKRESTVSQGTFGDHLT